MWVNRRWVTSQRPPKKRPPRRASLRSRNMDLVQWCRATQQLCQTRNWPHRNRYSKAAAAVVATISSPLSEAISMDLPPPQRPCSRACSERVSYMSRVPLIFALTPSNQYREPAEAGDSTAQTGECSNG